MAMVRVRKRARDLPPLTMGVGSRVRRRRVEPVSRFVPRMGYYTRPGETKYFDCGIQNSQTFNGATWADSEVPCDSYITSGGAVGAYTDSCLLPTAQGSGYGQVVGQRYHLKKLRIRGFLAMATLSDQLDVSDPAFARVILVMDTQPNGAQAQGEDIIQDVGAAAENIFSFMRTSTQTGRFRILADKFVTLNPSAASTDGSNTTTQGFNGVQFKMTYKPTKPLLVQIANGNATPTVGGTISHNIFLLLGGVRSNAAVGTFIYAASRAYYCE